MTYPHFDITKPDPAVDNHPDVWDKIQINTQALAHMIGFGALPGWNGAPVVGSGTAQQPEQYILTSVDTPATQLRATYTYGTVDPSAGVPVQIVLDYTVDSGSNWDVISTATLTYSESGAVPSVTWVQGP